MVYKEAEWRLSDGRVISKEMAEGIVARLRTLDERCRALVSGEISGETFERLTGFEASLIL